METLMMEGCAKTAGKLEKKKKNIRGSRAMQFQEEAESPVVTFSILL